MVVVGRGAIGELDFADAAGLAPDEVLALWERP